jgi:hypothetical protein
MAYEDFLKQEQYPKEQIKFLADVLQGVRLPQTTVTQSTTTPAQGGGASLIEKMIAGGAGASELIDMVKKYFPSKSDGSQYDYNAIYDEILKLTGGK